MPSFQPILKKVVAVMTRRFLLASSIILGLSVAVAQADPRFTGSVGTSSTRVWIGGTVTGTLTDSAAASPVPQADTATSKSVTVLGTTAGKIKVGWTSTPSGAFAGGTPSPTYGLTIKAVKAGQIATTATDISKMFKAPKHTTFEGATAALDVNVIEKRKLKVAPAVAGGGFILGSVTTPNQYLLYGAKVSTTFDLNTKDAAALITSDSVGHVSVARVALRGMAR